MNQINCNTFPKNPQVLPCLHSCLLLPQLGNVELSLVLAIASDSDSVIYNSEGNLEAKATEPQRSIAPEVSIAIAPEVSIAIAPIPPDPKQVSYKEWVIDSGIDKEIWELNCIPLYSHDEIAYRLYISDQLERRNDGRLVDKHYRQHLNMNTGWWCQGYQTDWGCFKPDQPRTDAKGRVIKYEHPEKTTVGIFAPKITRKIAKAIAIRNGTKFPKKVEVEDFWEWLIEDGSKIDLHICEGAKKAAAMLSLGYAAIGVPGIWAIADPTNKAELSWQLSRFCKHRNVSIVYDAPDREKSASDLNAACRRWVKLFLKNVATGDKNEVSFISWDVNWGKGIDDYIVKNGKEATHKLLAGKVGYWKLNYLTNKQPVCKNHVRIEDNNKYLSDSFLALNLSFTKKLTILISPKGTGKSKLIEGYALSKEAPPKALATSSRVTISKRDAESLGLSYASEKMSKNDQCLKTFRLSVVLDSLHENSQAQFHPSDWADCLLLIDEIDQAIKHLLYSPTLDSNRIQIIRNLAIILKNARQIIVASADVDVTTIEFIQRLGEISEDDTQIIEKIWNHNSYNCYFSEDSSAEKIASRMFESLLAGKKIMCACGSKDVKSAYSAQNLYARACELDPEGEYLCIDSETRLNREHPAHHYISNLNEAVKRYKGIFFTSVIGTAVDITEPGIDEVYGIFTGCQPPDDIRQMLMRYRILCDRHVWVAKTGMTYMGGGYLCPVRTKYSEEKKEEHLIGALSHYLLPSLDYPTLDEMPARNAYAKIAAATNYESKNYRQLVYEGLQKEGAILLIPEENAEEILLADKNIMKAVAEANTQTYYEKVHVKGDFLTDEELEALKKKKSEGGLTEKEQLSEKKTRSRKAVSTRFASEDKPVPVDDPKILQKINTSDWAKQLKLFFYLQNPHYAIFNDRERVLDANEKTTYTRDLFSRIYAQKLMVLEPLGLLELLIPGKYHKGHPAVNRIFELAVKDKQAIKGALGITIDEKQPMRSVQSIFSLLGLSCVKIKDKACLKTPLPDGTRRVDIFSHFAPAWELDDEEKPILKDDYPIPLDDEREQFYSIWKEEFDSHLETARKIKEYEAKKLERTEENIKQEIAEAEFYNKPVEIPVILPEADSSIDTQEEYEDLINLAAETDDEDLFWDVFNALPLSIPSMSVEKSLSRFIENRLSYGTKLRVHKWTENKYAIAKDYQAEMIG